MMLLQYLSMSREGLSDVLSIVKVVAFVVAVHKTSCRQCRQEVTRQTGCSYLVLGAEIVYLIRCLFTALLRTSYASMCWHKPVLC